MSNRLVVFTFDEEISQRLDKFLVSCLPEFSRSRLQSLIKEGEVRVNGALAYKAGQTIERGAVVEVHIPPPEVTNLIPETITLDIVFENEDLMVINKPAGMVVHPSAGHSSGTLVHAALAHAPDIEGIGGQQRPGVVHRLDKNTSGLILLAKNDQAHRWLQNQFRNRQVEKTYITLVDGHPPTPSGRVEANIGRDTTQRKRMRAMPPDKGREAVSEYHSLERYENHTLLEVHPITGRTHQIRVHMAFLGCPVVGDTVYGHRHPSLEIKRHFLHAAKLVINLPRVEEPHTFETPLPDELDQILEMLRH